MGKNDTVHGLRGYCTCALLENKGNNSGQGIVSVRKKGGWQFLPASQQTGSPCQYSMNQIIVAPSVLSMDYSRMNEQLNEVMESGAAWLHFDVMDGHFVPNLTFGPDVLKGFRKACSLFLDVHVMIERPLFFLEKFLSAGADNYTFHYEVMKSEEDIHNLASLIHAHGKSAGISIKPDTDVSVLKPFLKDFDVFLIMCVEPGFGGQKFIPESLDKIRTLRGWLNEAGLSSRIEVDGGINETTSALVRSAGADVLVAGSYVFDHDIKKAVSTLA